MKEMAGKAGEIRASKIGMEQMLVSMGHQTCGALTLWNYPSWMRNLVAHDAYGEDRPDPVDMAAMESNFHTLTVIFLMISILSNLEFFNCYITINIV